MNQDCSMQKMVCRSKSGRATTLKMVQKAASTVRDFTQNHNEQRQLITTKDKRQLRLLRIKAIGNTTPCF
jgi:hypothetical protein